MPWDDESDSCWLVYLINQDARFADSDLLSARQQQNWNILEASINSGGNASLAALGQALRDTRRDDGLRVPPTGAYFAQAMPVHERPKHPTWWELWTPPKGIFSGKKTIGHALLDQGTVTIRSERRTQDIQSYSMAAPLTVVESAAIYLDFMPNDQWSFRSYLQRVGLSDPTEAYRNGGWWHDDRIGFRQIVRECKYTCDPEHPEKGYTSFAALMMAPPPYGCWLPTLDFDRLGNR